MIFVGGGIGSLCRFGLAYLLKQTVEGFPWATFLANLMSCFLLGVLVGLSLKGQLSAPYRFMLMTGFCGGFSTFSAFSYETYELVSSGDYRYAAANVGASILAGIISLFLGIRLMG